MILSISIENFRSIKNKQTLLFNASNCNDNLSTNVFCCPISNCSYLQSISFYGANASGKSNILLAFKALQYLVTSSGNLCDSDNIPCYEPFKLDKKSQLLPTRFEISFLSQKSIRYHYKIAFTANTNYRRSLRLLSE